MMDTALEITMNHGECCLDSRVLAKRLGYEHHTITRSIQRHKTRLETKSVVRQNVEKPSEGSQGGRPEVYYLLNERQCLILVGSLKKGEEAEEWHDALVDAFLQARERVRQLEGQQHVPTSIHTLTQRFRPRALENMVRVPDGYFSVMGELFKHLYNVEALLNQSLDEYAMIEVSVGQRWSRYAREVLGIPDQERHRYPHLCQNDRTEHVWAYPTRYVDLFGKWLWVVYFPEQFPAYTLYRARYIGVSATHQTTKKQITSTPVNQLPMFAETKR